MRRMSLLILLSVSIITLSSKALIIYVSQFDDPTISPLTYARNDALRFKETLLQLDLVDEDNLILLENPTLARMKSFISRFFKSASSGEKLYFFYSGHGYYDEDTSKTYFIPRDADPNDIANTAYSIEDDLKPLLEETNAEVFMFIDACYSGSIGRKKPLSFLHFSKLSLDEMAKTHKVGMLLSSGPKETSQEDEELQSGVFTYYLTQGMWGKANRDEDEVITFKELAEYVKDNVSKRTLGKQNPQVFVSRTLMNERISVDYSVVELKVLRDLKDDPEVPDEIKEIVGKVVAQPYSKDTKAEWAVRNYIRKLGLGKIDLETFIELVETKMDELKATASSRSEKMEKFGTVKIKIEGDMEIVKEAFVQVGKQKKAVKDLVVFEKVPVGKARVVLEGPYVERVEKEISVEPFETKYIEIRPERATVGIFIDSEPQDAEIYIDGKKIPDRTPYTTRIPVGRHEIVVKKPGYKEYKKVVELKKVKGFYEIKAKLEEEVYGIRLLGLPKDMVMAQKVELKILGKFALGERELEMKEVKIELRGDAVRVSGKELEAVMVGTSEVVIRYKGMEIKERITVHYAEVELETEPEGAEVYVFGKKVGITPLKTYIDSPVVELKVEKEGYEAKEIRMKLKAGERIKKKIVLKPIVKGLRVELPEKVMVGYEWKVEVKAQMAGEKEKDLKPGELEIEVENAKVMGSTVVFDRAGEAKVRIRYKGMEEERVVKVVYSQVFIESEPEGADVYVNGERVGKTPVKVDVYGAKAVVELKKEGYALEKREIEAKRGGITTLKVKLKTEEEGKVSSLMMKGKVNEAVRLLEGMGLREEEKEEILDNLRRFDEEGLKGVGVETKAGEMLKRYAVELVKEFKEAVGRMDARKTAEILDELYPEVANELRKYYKPWAWAYKTAFEKGYEKLSELLKENAEKQGAKLEKRVVHGDMAFGFTYVNVEIVSGLEGFTHLADGLTFTIAWKVSDSPTYFGYYVGLVQALISCSEGTSILPPYCENTSSVGIGGLLPVGLIFGKPMMGFDDPSYWYVRGGIQLTPGSEGGFLMLEFSAGYLIGGVSAGMVLADKPMLYLGVYTNLLNLPMLTWKTEKTVVSLRE